MSEEKILFGWSRSDFEETAGRKITDEEAARIVKACEYSTAGEAVADAVFQVCGMPEDESGDEA